MVAVSQIFFTLQSTNQNSSPYESLQHHSARNLRTPTDGNRENCTSLSVPYLSVGGYHRGKSHSIAHRNTPNLAVPRYLACYASARCLWRAICRRARAPVSARFSPSLLGVGSPFIFRGWQRGCCPAFGLVVGHICVYGCFVHFDCSPLACVVHFGDAPE